jgi:uncharacterized protein YciI
LGGAAKERTMPRDTDVPDAFDVYTVVVLRRPADAPEMSDEDLDALQARHLAYRAELRRQGLVVANGPFEEQSDPSYRGMSIFACDAATAARLSAGDPSVVAGRLASDVMEWWVSSGSVAFPLTDRPVGDRRFIPEA